MNTHTEIDIDAPAEVVFGVLWDVARYPEFVSDVVDAIVEPGADPHTLRATMEVQLLRVRRYTVDMVAEPPWAIRWTLERGDSLVRNDGAWLLSPNDDGGVHVRYELGIEFALAVPDAVVRKMVDFHLPVMLKQFKARAEQIRRTGG